MTSRHPVVFLVDVDNTLIDNDRIAADLKRHLEREIGRERQERYWVIFEELRAALGYADWGVELGKALATTIVSALDGDAEPALAHDSSTNTLIRRFRAFREGSP